MGRWGKFWILVALLAGSAGCAGQAGTILAGEQRSPSANGQHVAKVAGTFEVLRYNADGLADPSLDGTIEVSVKDTAGPGGLTAVTINVSDPAGLDSVCINVNYDSSAVHPQRAEFHGLLGNEEHALSAAFLDRPGTAGLASAPIGGYQPGRFSGGYATLYFANGPCRSVSAIGDVHSNPWGVANQYVNDSTAGADNLFAASDWTQGWASVSWTAAWHCGDGDQNGETNAADIVPLARFFGENTQDNWSAAVADYDLNTEVNGSDIVRIGRFFGEKTDAYIVEAGDNDGSEPVEVAQLDWTDALFPTAGADEVLSAAFKYWEIHFDISTPVSFEQLLALDLDEDGLISIFVTPVTLVDDTAVQAGATSVASVEVRERWFVWNIITISGYDIEISGADDGSGGYIFDGDDATAAPSAAIIEDANSGVSFSLNAIRGTFNGVAFDENNLAPNMTQEHYYNALESARENLIWSYGHGGALTFRRTADWISLDSGNPHPAPFTVIGDPGTGTVFPDDDPESSGELAEGLLYTTLPVGDWGMYWASSDTRVMVLQDVAYDFTVDIEADESAAVLLDYSNVYLVSIINQEFSIWFEWGDGGEPADLGNVDLQLVSIEQNGVVGPGVIDFDYEPGGAVNGREFSLNLEGDKTIDCIVPGASLQPGKAYAFRFFDGTTWSSINKPEYLLAVNSGG